MDDSAILSRSSTADSDQSAVANTGSSKPKGQRAISTHSLLGSPNPTELRRKPQAETDRTPIDRASISMPPPLAKPSTDRRLSTTVMAANAPSKSPRSSTDGPQSPPGSITGFPLESRQSYLGSPTTATDTTPVTTAASNTVQTPGLPVLSPPALPSDVPNEIDIVGSQAGSPTLSKSDTAVNQSVPAGQTLNVKPESAQGALPLRAPRNNVSRSISAQRRLSTPSQRSSDIPEKEAKASIGKIGVCALDVKARSRPSRQILTRLSEDGEFDVHVFGDKAILDEGKYATAP